MLIINTALVEGETSILSQFSKKIIDCCPCIDIKAITNTADEAHQTLKKLYFDLIIIDLEAFSFSDIKKVFKNDHQESEIIYVSKTAAHAIEALQGHTAEYLTKPIQDNVLLDAVRRVKQRLIIKEQLKKSNLLLENLLAQKKKNQSIGIPTIEGFSFFSINEIIRCEGLQKCTRVFTTTKTDIISSYNIGQFKKLLEPYGFFTTHKSHLINLDFMKQYYREGSIILKDNSRIPVSKRRKSTFLKQVMHP